jgi:RNA polymerase sigma-70 factor (ECF subfamily)
LYGVVRIVALRFETRRRGQREHQFPKEMDLEEVAGSEDDLAEVFDRAWAKNLFREAAQLQQQRALKIGGKSWQRVELLRLRFQQGMPIREIARGWQIDAAEVHHEYAKARQEFKEALLEVMAFHHPGTPAEIEEECARLAAFWS